MIAVKGQGLAAALVSRRRSWTSVLAARLLGALLLGCLVAGAQAQTAGPSDLAIAPDAHVVYVDVEPVVLTHGRALLAGTPEVTVIQGDARRPDDILNDPELNRLIDFGRPVAVLMLAVLHFIGDEDDPHRIVARLRSAMAPGSYLAVSHVTADFDADSSVRDAGAVYEKATYQITLRSREQITRLFDGFDLVDPGLATLSMWRPDPGTSIPPSAERQWCYAGVGHKTG